jgi:group I intron endonuclease
MKFTKNSGIYCFENIINNKKYIGKTINLNCRINGHIRDLDKNKDLSVALQNAYNKYGKENFIIYIIEECDINFLNEKEIFWIKELHSHISENGYNISWGGSSGMSGLKHSDETKRKLSERVRSAEEKEKIAEWHRGRPIPDATKIKLSIFYKEYFKTHDAPMKGKISSEETKLKQSKAKRGKKFLNSSSKYIGVRLRNGRYTAELCMGGKNIHIGSFGDEIEAALAYNEFAKNILGDDAVLNIINLNGLSPYEYISNLEKNYKKRKNTSSKYVGVSFDKSRNKWISYFISGEKTIYVGRFLTETEAAMAYNEYALEYLGWKAKLNIISEEEIRLLWDLLLE